MSPTDELFERQAPSNNSQAWEDDNFSGLYSGTNSTFLAAYWNQNIQNVSQELVVLFQEDTFANGITQGRYTSNSTTSNPWVANNFGFSQPKGSTFAMSLVSYQSGKHLMLYTVDEGKNLQQHEYTISDTDLDSKTVISLNSQSGKYPSQTSTLSNSPYTLTPQFSNRPERRATIPSRSRCPRQPAPIYNRQIARVHAEYTLDQPNPFRRSGPQLSSFERMELLNGLLKSHVRDQASPEVKHDVSLPGGYER